MNIFEALQHGPNVPSRPICIMGVNGAGKSRFLRDLHRQLTLSGRRAVLISAHRDFTGHLNSYSPSVPGNLDPYQLLEMASSQMPGPQPDLPTLIHAALARAQSLDQQEHHRFVQRVAEWLEDEKPDPEPAPPRYIMETLLSDLGGILGYPLRLIAPENQPRRGSELKLVADLSGNLIPITDLSSGERQILLFAILMFQSPSEHVTVLVDEPELHLNEARAITLWEGLEAKLGNATFIYATHSVNFATRPGLGHLFTVEPGQRPREISPSGPLPFHLVKDIVGARVQIRRSQSVPIFCEDRGHAMLLSDLICSHPIEPIVVEGRDRVIRAVLSRAEYERVLPDHPIRLGVIDCDNATEGELSTLERNGVLGMPYNEFESLLLHPEIANNFIYLQDVLLTKDHYERILLKSAEKALPETLQKLKSAVEEDFKPTITYAIREGNVTAKSEVRGAPEEAFLREAKALQAALNRVDIDAILTLFKGKKLYQHFQKTVGLNRGSMPERGYDFYRNLREIPRFREHLFAIPKVQEMKQRIEAAIEMQGRD